MEKTTNKMVMSYSSKILLTFASLVFLLLASVDGSSGEYHIIPTKGIDPGKVSGQSDQNNHPEESIKIGLLLTTAPESDLLALSAARGARMAIDRANESAGHKGPHFELVIRTSDGLWGAGSKESVSFVHEDQVVAIITSLDGRNAHLAEQVAAKSHVVQIATRATEETLSQAFVPWFFRIVPDDNRQAEALAEEIFLNQGYTRVHLLQEDGYDGAKGADAFDKAAREMGHKIMGRSVFESGKADGMDPAIEDGTEALVVFGTFKSASPILDRLKKAFPSLQLFGTLSMTADGQIGAGYSNGCEGGIFVSSKFCFTTPGQAFKDHFKEAYGQIPNPTASYAYDAASLLVEAIRRVGPDREKIRDALKEIDYPGGVTGPIRFDEHGNRTSPAFLIRIIRGHPVILNP